MFIKPALYTTANSPQRLSVDDFSDEFIKEIGKMSGRCLDIGSGPGDTVVDFILPKMDHKASLVCSDKSEEMVNYGKEKYRGNERVSFIKLNIESPDLANDLVEQFDNVTSFFCLNWCQDLRKAFENIHNLIRPGGIALLIFLAKFPAMNSYTRLAARPRYQPYMKDADRYLPILQHSEGPHATLDTLMEDVGFEIHHSSVREKSHTFDNLDGLRKFLLAVNPFTERMPADLAEEYKKDLVDEFARDCIIFKKNNNAEEEYSVTISFGIFIIHLKKPLAD